jgi:Zn-dependent protease
MPDLQTIIARVLVLVIAFTVHELAHALTADYLGDPTPRRMGRITLNPLKHLDPIGTLLLIVAGFGWAKPVMVNPMNMRGNPRTSMAIVAAAGPLSNLILATLGAMLVRFGLVSFSATSSALSPAFLLGEFIWINLILALFNLIPIPPLDGSKILFAILPGELVYRLRPLEQFGFLILMGVIFFAPQVMQTVIVQPALALMTLLVG